MESGLRAFQDHDSSSSYNSQLSQMSRVTLCATVNVLETKVGAYCKLAPVELNNCQHLRRSTCCGEKEKWLIVSYRIGTAGACSCPYAYICCIYI